MRKFTTYMMMVINVKSEKKNNTLSNLVLKTIHISTSFQIDEAAYYIQFNSNSMVEAEV